MDQPLLPLHRLLNQPHLLVQYTPMLAHPQLLLSPLLTMTAVVVSLYQRPESTDIAVVFGSVGRNPIGQLSWPSLTYSALPQSQLSVCCLIQPNHCSSLRQCNLPSHHYDSHSTANPTCAACSSLSAHSGSSATSCLLEKSNQCPCVTLPSCPVYLHSLPLQLEPALVAQLMQLSQAAQLAKSSRPK